MQQDLDEPPDSELMQHLVAGHDEAMSKLLRRWQAKLISYLTRLINDAEVARDLAQETFVRVYQHRNRYDVLQPFSTWLFSIATNLARNHHRWRQRHPEAPLEAQQLSGLDQVQHSPTPHQALAKKEAADAVRKAIHSLPEDQRTALILSYYEDLAQKEIAEVMKCSVKGVELKIYRARQTLREVLSGLISC